MTSRAGEALGPRQVVRRAAGGSAADGRRGETLEPQSADQVVRRTADASAIDGHRRRGERGATMIELAMLMPVVLAVVLLVVQFTLWFHGRQVADAAAREGARVARAAGDSDGWQASAEAKAAQIVQAVGPELLKGAQVTAWEEGDQRGVEVTGDAVQVVPLLPDLAFTITARFGGPIECFRPDNGSGECE